MQQVALTAQQAAAELDRAFAAYQQAGGQEHEMAVIQAQQACGAAQAAAERSLKSWQTTQTLQSQEDMQGRQIQHDTVESARDRAFRWQSQELGQNWQTGERLGSQDWQTGERLGSQDWQSGENRLDRQHEVLSLIHI